MKNFDWTKFTERIAIKSDLKSVYQYWTSSKELEKWFLLESNFYDKEAGRIPKTKTAEKGHTYEWNWYAQKAFEKGDILEANGKDFLKFSFAGNCKVEVTLTEKNKRVIVEIMQYDIPENENAKQDIRLGCAFGWAFYLVNLKSVLEGGLDLRNKEEGFKNHVND